MAHLIVGLARSAGGQSGPVQAADYSSVFPGKSNGCRTAEGNQVEPSNDFDAIPRGKYIAIISESEMKQAKAFPWCVPHLDVGMAQDVAIDFIEKLKRLAPDAGRIVDKLPANSFALGLIAQFWPNAKIIHCVRDPMDVLVSKFTRFYIENNQPFSWDLEDLGHYHRQHERLMQHWHKVLPIEIPRVRYEDVVSDLETQTRRLLDFLGVPWDPKCLEFDKHNHRITPNSLEVKRPIYTSSVGKWRRYEKNLGRLKAALEQEPGFAAKPKAKLEPMSKAIAAAAPSSKSANRTGGPML